MGVPSVGSIVLCELLGAWCGRVCPGVLLQAVWALLPAQRGLHGNQAALGFHGNSRAEPGNTSSGRKAAAARREPAQGPPG